MSCRILALAQSLHEAARLMDQPEGLILEAEVLQSISQIRGLQALPSLLLFYGGIAQEHMVICVDRRVQPPSLEASQRIFRLQASQSSDSGHTSTAFKQTIASVPDSIRYNRNSAAVSGQALVERSSIATVPSPSQARTQAQAGAAGVLLMVTGKALLQIVANQSHRQYVWMWEWREARKMNI